MHLNAWHLNSCESSYSDLSRRVGSGSGLPTLDRLEQFVGTAKNCAVGVCRIQSGIGRVNRHEFPLAMLADDFSAEIIDTDL